MLTLQTAILSVPALTNACLLRKLAGGPTSDSWLLSLGNSKAVLRIDKPLARVLSLNRAAELDVLEQVAHAGFGPAIICADLAKGMLVTEYISGTHWTISDASKPENIERLAVRLRELHSASIKGPVMGIAEAAGHYASVTGTAQAREWHAQVTAMLQFLGSELTEWSLCHNDLGHRNIVDTGSIMFVDWEYSALGHPLFDLAGIVRQNGYSEAQASQLQRAYFGTSAAQLRRRLRLFSRLYDLVSALWCQAVCAKDGGTATIHNQLETITVRLRQESD